MLNEIVNNQSFNEALNNCNMNFTAIHDDVLFINDNTEERLYDWTMGDLLDYLIREHKNKLSWCDSLHLQEVLDELIQLRNNL